MEPPGPLFFEPMVEPFALDDSQADAMLLLAGASQRIMDPGDHLTVRVDRDRRGVTLVWRLL
jgi:hypothetical protein